MIDGIAPKYLLTDQEYDQNRALAATRACAMAPAIPPKRSRQDPQSYDEALYQARHLLENCFGQLIGMAQRGDALCQESSSVPGIANLMRFSVSRKSGQVDNTPYLAICQIRALALWAKVI